MLTEEYKSELARLKVELERRSPNLKSLGQVQGAMDNLNATSHEADVARREIEAIEAQFQEVRTARTKRFMDAGAYVASYYLEFQWSSALIIVMVTTCSILLLLWVLVLG
eukprot:2831299-Amphidinium_carterae.1